MKRLIYEAIREVVAYLDDERKDYEARKENGEPTRGHIWKSVKILAAYQVESGAIITEEPICTQCGDEIKRESVLDECGYCSKPHCDRCLRCWHCSDGQTKLFVCRRCYVLLSEAEAEPKEECPHCKRLDYLEACQRCKENYCGLCLRFVEWLRGKPNLCPRCHEKAIFKN